MRCPFLISRERTNFCNTKKSGQPSASQPHKFLFFLQTPGHRLDVPAGKRFRWSLSLHFSCCGGPGEIRTPDTQVRSLLLYPTELRAHSMGKMKNLDGGPGEIRTPDAQVRSLLLYPTELRAHSREKGKIFDGGPGEIRTPDTQVRSLLLYPTELRAHSQMRTLILLRKRVKGNL